MTAYFNRLKIWILQRKDLYLLLRKLRSIENEACLKNLRISNLWSLLPHPLQPKLSKNKNPQIKKLAMNTSFVIQNAHRKKDHSRFQQLIYLVLLEIRLIWIERRLMGVKNLSQRRAPRKKSKPTANLKRNWSQDRYFLSIIMYEWVFGRIW